MNCRRFAKLSIFLLVVFTSIACSTLKVKKEIHRDIGVIKSIDSKNGEVTISQDGLGIVPIIEATRTVANKKLLKTLKIGDKVEVEIAESHSKLVFTKIKKISDKNQQN